MLATDLWENLKKSPSLLTRSNDFSELSERKEKNICCSQHFFWRCQMEKTTSTFDPSARKPNALSKLDVDHDDPSKDFFDDGQKTENSISADGNFGEMKTSWQVCTIILCSGLNYFQKQILCD